MRGRVEESWVVHVESKRGFVHHSSTRTNVKTTAVRKSNCQDEVASNIARAPCLDASHVIWDRVKLRYSIWYSTIADEVVEDVGYEILSAAQGYFGLIGEY